MPRFLAIGHTKYKLRTVFGQKPSNTVINKAIHQDLIRLLKTDVIR